MGSKGRILVAMSGGVDSSVTAALCLEQGYEVVGVAMHLYDASCESVQGSCCSPDDFDDARAVAQKMDFPFYVVNLADRFESAVIDNFIDEYLKGRTPIPCIHCNNDLKFEALRIKAQELDCVAVATGHYARVIEQGGKHQLLTGVDNTRDQSYFLFGLTQKQLSQVAFPVGGMLKSEVREKARELGLKVADKGESREICFVPDDDYVTFLRKRRLFLSKPGNIRLRNGEVIGRHDGIHRFTVGQRKGLGIGWTEPLYVLELLPEEDEVIVGTRDETFSNGLFAKKMNWIDGQPPETGTRCKVKIRYKHSGETAQLFPTPDGGCEIRFDRPIGAVAPGQAAVAYEGEKVLGGGWIERANP